MLHLVQNLTRRGGYLGTELLSEDGLHEGDQCGTSRNRTSHRSALEFCHAAKTGYGEDRDESLKGGPERTGDDVSPVNGVHAQANFS